MSKKGPSRATTKKIIQKNTVKNTTDKLTWNLKEKKIHRKAEKIKK